MTGYEINISCPNVKKGGLAFGYDIKKVNELTCAIRKNTGRLIVVKLGPDMETMSIAKVCMKNRIDAISLINTLPVIKLSGSSGKYYFKSRIAGMSGPCIKPLALKKVNEVSKFGIPVIGIGGIMCVEDVLEFLQAGARLVQVGSANLIDPTASKKIVRELKYCNL